MIHLIPHHSGTINSFVMPTIHGPLMKDTVTYVPYQDNTGVCIDQKAETFLRTLKVTGWDWLPERLHQYRMFGMTVFGTSTSQRENEITPKLEAEGFKVVPVAITFVEFKSLYDVPKPAVTLPQPSGHNAVNDFHKRVRYLWKNHHTAFSQFELDFVKSIGTLLGNGRSLSPKQDAVIQKILTKYKVPANAVAGILSRLAQ